MKTMGYLISFVLGFLCGGLIVIIIAVLGIGQKGGE